MSYFSAGELEEALEALGGRSRRFSGDLAPEDLAFDRKRAAFLLSRAIRSGRYTLQPATIHIAVLEGKPRRVFRSTLLDAAVERVASSVVSAALEPRLVAGLHSYRRGRSAAGAIRGFASYVQAHRARIPEPRRRGLFVLRRDVAAYGDMIPVGHDSRLWPLLDSALTGLWPRDRRVARVLIQDIVRRRYWSGDGEPMRLAVGTPTGSSIQPPINNLYLTPLDEAVRKLAPDAFYARFGDDIAFATPSANLATQVARRLDTELEALGLRWSESKCADIFFNGAARDRGSWPGRDAVDLLGFEVTFRGTTRLAKKTWRPLVRELRRRLRLAASELPREKPEDVIPVLGAVLSSAIDPSDPVALSTAQRLAAVDDRPQLAELDALLRLNAAELATGVRGPRAFRRLPPRRLVDLGFESVTARANRRTRWRAADHA